MDQNKDVVNIQLPPSEGVSGGSGSSQGFVFNNLSDALKEIPGSPAKALKDEIDRLYKEHRNYISEFNQELKEVVSHSRPGPILKSWSTRIAKGEDQIPGFDLAVERLLNEPHRFPQIISHMPTGLSAGKNDYEEALRQAILKGIQKPLLKRDPSFLQQAMQTLFPNVAHRLDDPSIGKGDAWEPDPESFEGIIPTGKEAAVFPWEVDPAGWEAERNRLFERDRNNANEILKSMLPPIAFKTAKGSMYMIDEQGRTVRYKSLHEGHDPKDVGKKDRSDVTYYVNSEDAQRIGMHNSLNKEARARLLIRGEQLALLSWNQQQNRFGTHGNPIQLSMTPKVGLSPLELWDLQPAIGGLVPRSSHPGNPITELHTMSQMVSGDDLPRIGYDPHVVTRIPGSGNIWQWAGGSGSSGPGWMTMGPSSGGMIPYQPPQDPWDYYRKLFAGIGTTPMMGGFQGGNFPGDRIPRIGYTPYPIAEEVLRSPPGPRAWVEANWRNWTDWLGTTDLAPVEMVDEPSLPQGIQRDQSIRGRLASVDWKQTFSQIDRGLVQGYAVRSVIQYVAEQVFESGGNIARKMADMAFKDTSSGEYLASMPEVAGKISNIVGVVGGGIAGGALGAYLGSAFPGIGTVTGGTMGAVIGSVMGPVLSKPFEELAETIRSVDKAFQSMIDSVGGLSPHLAAVQAMGGVNMLMAQLERAREIGPELADLEYQRNRMDVLIYRRKTAYADMVLPYVTSGLETINDIIEGKTHYLGRYLGRKFGRSLGYPGTEALFGYLGETTSYGITDAFRNPSRITDALSSGFSYGPFSGIYNMVSKIAEYTGVSARADKSRETREIADKALSAFNEQFLRFLDPASMPDKKYPASRSPASGRGFLGSY